MRHASLLESIPAVTLGLLLVTFAVLRAPWPPDQVAPNNLTVSYFERMQGKQIGVPTGQSERSPVWYGRRVLDALALCLLVIGYVSAALLTWRNERRALIVLVVVGALGTLYSGSVGLYPGPIIATGGFGLILCGAGLTWASRCAIKTGRRQATFETVNHPGTEFEGL
jgi:hypothetical protein